MNSEAAPAGLEYHPVQGDADDFLENCEPTRFLLVGQGLPKAFDRAEEVAFFSPWRCLTLTA